MQIRLGFKNPPVVKLRKLENFLCFSREGKRRSVMPFGNYTLFADFILYFNRLSVSRWDMTFRQSDTILETGKLFNRKFIIISPHLDIFPISSKLMSSFYTTPISAAVGRFPISESPRQVHQVMTDSFILLQPKL